MLIIINHIQFFYYSSYYIIILLIQIGFNQFQYMAYITMLWKIRSHFKWIATSYSQRIKIEPFCFSFSYNGNTFCYCSSHCINHLNQNTGYPGMAVSLIYLVYMHYKERDSYVVLKLKDEPHLFLHVHLYP